MDGQYMPDCPDILLNPGHSGPCHATAGITIMKEQMPRTIVGYTIQN